MRPSRAWWVVVGWVSVASGCSKSAPPAAPAVSLEQVCNGADGSKVRLTGYVRYRRELLSFCSNYGGHKTCDLELSASSAPPPDFDILHPSKEPEAPSAKLSVPVGAQPGEMDELPDKFKASDIKLHLPNGAAVSDGGKVTIDGALSVIAGSTPKSCFVNVEWATPG